MPKLTNNELTKLMLEGLRMDYETRETTDVDEQVLYLLANEAIAARLEILDKTVGINENGAVVKITEGGPLRVRFSGKNYFNLDTGRKYTPGIGRPPKWVSEYRKANPAK